MNRNTREAERALLKAIRHFREARYRITLAAAAGDLVIFASGNQEGLGYAGATYGTREKLLDAEDALRDLYVDIFGEEPLP